MLKNASLGKFEINDKHYKHTSNYVLQNINKHRETNKFYRELITLSLYLFKYNIKPLNLKKLPLSPDFLIEDKEKNTYLIEIFFSKNNNDWKKHAVLLDWSLSNSNEDLKKLKINVNPNDSVNKNLEIIQESLNKLPLEEIRCLNQSGIWEFNPNPLLKDFEKHMNKIKNYRTNNKSINNLTLLIEMGIDKCIEYNNMVNFSELILLNVKENNDNLFSFKIKIILINQIATYAFDIN